MIARFAVVGFLFLLLVDSAFTDSFTDDFSSGTDDPRYTVQSGEWLRQNGELVVGSGTRGAVMFLPVVTGTVPFVLSVDLMIDNTEASKAALGLQISADQPGQYVMLRIRSDKVELFNQDPGGDGGGKPRTKSAFLPLSGPLQPSVWYRLTVESSGSGAFDIKLIERDASAANAQPLTSGPLTSANIIGSEKIGLFVSRGLGARFDNLSFKAK